MPLPTIHTDSLQVADSVARFEAPLADSLATAAAEQSDTLSRLAVSAGEIFGQGSFAPPYGPTAQIIHAADTPGIVYQLMALGLTLFYFFAITTQRADIAQSFGVLSGKRIGERNNDNHSHVYNRTMKILVSMGAFTYGMATLRALHTAGILTTAYSSWYALLVVIAVAAAILLINELQQMILRITGALTFENKFVTSLIASRRVFAAMTGLTVTPVVFFFALTREQWAITGLWIALGVFSLFMLWYLAYSLKLFLKEKVSILVWFLYLCAVEVVPYGILILGILRTD